MEIIVKKYGGTSVGNIDRVKSVAKRIIEEKNSKHGIVVVVSAPAGMTDDLLTKAKEISIIPNRRELDALLSTGEQISSAFLSMAIQELGEKAISFNGMQLNIKTTSDHFDAKVESIDSEKIQHYLNEGYIVVITGFQGVDEYGDITTLGRGGSDTSAVALGVALKAKEVEIYTDVEGVYTADPRIVKKTRKLIEMTYSEMLELATAGAKVLHNRCVELAAKYGIVIHLRSSFSHEKGTLIKESVVEKTVISGIAHSLNEHEVIVYDVKSAEVYQILENLKNHGIVVDNISFFNDDNKRVMKFLVSKNFSDEAIQHISKEFQQLVLEKNTDIGKITVVGMGIKSKGIVQKCVEFFSRSSIPLISMTTSEISCSFIVPAAYCHSAVELLHKGLIEK